MRHVFFASDLHIDVRNGFKTTQTLASFLEDHGTSDDVLVLCGDYGNTNWAVMQCLDLFAGFPGYRLAIPGNHDVWINQGEKFIDSESRYNSLKYCFKESGFHPLHLEPVVIGSTAFVGAMGWYDYSYGDWHHASEEEYIAKTSERLGVAWGDGQYVRWEVTDRQKTYDEAQKIIEMAKGLQDDPNVQEIMVAIHHVPCKQHLFHPRWLVKKHWRFLNGFLGSNSLANQLPQFSKVSTVVSGHIHRRSTKKFGGISYVSIGGGYDHKELVVFKDGNLRRHKF